MGAALGYPFLDVDTLIESSANCSIPEIFASDGEDAFRDMETQVLKVSAPPSTCLLQGWRLRVLLEVLLLPGGLTEPRRRARRMERRGCARGPRRS